MAVVYALLAALGNALNVITQHTASIASPKQTKGWRLVGYLFRSPLWLLGWVALAAAFVFQALALHDGQMSVVQPLLVSELVFALVLRRFWIRQPIRPVTWWAAAITCVSLAVFLATAEPQGGHSFPDNSVWVAACATVAGGAAVLALAGTRGPPARRAALPGSATAAMWALVATFIKTMTYTLSQFGVAGMFAHWPVYALAAAGLVTEFLQQATLHAGPLSVSQPFLVIVDPIVSIALSVWIFDETFTDPEMRLESVLHGGLTWRYAYDRAGRPVTETDYNGGVTQYAYDAAGQLVKRVNAAGQEISYAYDALGNVAERLAGEELTSFRYDEAGRFASARNADAEIVVARDALGRVTAETCDGRTVSTSYDEAGRVTSRITPSGAATTWYYDDAGLPAVMRAGGRELRFGYGASGQETSRELPGGLTLLQEWDQLSRLSGQVLEGPAGGVGPAGPAGPVGPTVGGPVLQRRSYAYNPDGFVTGISDLLTGNRVFGLDASGRVTTVTGTEWSEQYTYDPAGNIASASWPAPPLGGSGATAAWAPWLGTDSQGGREVTGTLISRAGNLRYRYDAAGRVVVRTRTRISRKPETWRYEWDADNRLVAVAAPDGTTWRYRYDPLGRRVAKQHIDASGNVLTRHASAGTGPSWPNKP